MALTPFYTVWEVEPSDAFLEMGNMRHVLGG